MLGFLGGGFVTVEKQSDFTVSQNIRVTQAVHVLTLFRQDVLLWLHCHLLMMSQKPIYVYSNLRNSQHLFPCQEKRNAMGRVVDQSVDQVVLN